MPNGTVLGAPVRPMHWYLVCCGSNVTAAGVVVEFDDESQARQWAAKNGYVVEGNGSR